MMVRGKKLQNAVRSVHRVLNGIPVTVKLRTGVKSSLPLAHSLIPKLEQWGASMVTVSIHIT